MSYSTNAANMNTGFVSAFSSNYGSNYGSSAQLQYQDFWPQNLTPQEKLKRATFETFDVLVGRMNNWLAQNENIDVKNFQTVEKKVSSYEELNADTVAFAPQSGWSIYLKGLRVWYGTDGSGHVGQVGYMNVLPRIIDDSHRTPAFEKLGGIFQNANDTMQSSPIPGRIITIETVSLQFHEYDPRRIFPDTTFWIDGYVRDVFSFVRIFFTYGNAVPEIIGAADFVPECVKERGIFSAPSFAPSSSVGGKIAEWLRNVQDIRIVNIQCLETPYPDKSELMDSSINFIIAYEGWYTVKFLRVYYARPQHTSIERPIAQQVSVKTFLPARVHRTCCTQVTSFQPMSGLDHYAREWLRVVGKRVLFAELEYRPIRSLYDCTDFQDDVTVITGHWYTVRSKNSTHYYRHHMVSIIRVYLEGYFTEPPPERLPPVPHFDDEACCTIL